MEPSRVPTSSWLVTRSSPSPCCTWPAIVTGSTGSSMATFPGLEVGLSLESVPPHTVSKSMAVTGEGRGGV